MFVQVSGVPIRAIIPNNRLGDQASGEVCQKIRLDTPSTATVCLSGEARPAEIEKALKAGRKAYLIKPVDFDKLTETVPLPTSFGRSN